VPPYLGVTSAGAGVVAASVSQDIRRRLEHFQNESA
jgi:hypothetical protein